MFSVRRIFRVQFSRDKIAENRDFQTRNAMNVGITYFGSRGFCGAIGVSFSLLDRVMGALGRLFKRRELRHSVPSLY